MEHGISLLLNGTLTKTFRDKEFINGEQGRKSGIFKRSREHATPYGGLGSKPHLGPVLMI